LGSRRAQTEGGGGKKGKKKTKGKRKKKRRREKREYSWSPCPKNFGGRPRPIGERGRDGGQGRDGGEREEKEKKGREERKEGVFYFAISFHMTAA